MSTCENERGSIAVHCKAGLGRTGTNIAAYMMKHYGYSAKEATAWCRVCRPGCVVGPQQQYLETIQERMWQEGRRYRLERQGTEAGGAHAFNLNATRGIPLHKSARVSQNSEMIESSHKLSIEHVDSSITSRILKKQQLDASVQGRVGLSRTMNGSTTERERTPSITSRPNTSSGLDSVSNENRERRDSRNGRKGSGNIDWTLQHESKQLTITTSSSRPKTSSYSDTDVTRSSGGGGTSGTRYPSTLNDLHEKKQSFNTATTAASNGSSRSLGSNGSNTTKTQTPQPPPPVEDRSSSTSSSLTRMLWSSTKSKLKSSSVSPTTATAANSSSTTTTRSLNSREGTSANPRKGSFGKSNVANASLGMKKLSTK